MTSTSPHPPSLSLTNTQTHTHTHWRGSGYLIESVCSFGHVTGRSASKCSLTCALFDSRSFLQRVATELALKIILPELCKPDIPSVVLQRPASEVAVKTCKEKKQQNKSKCFFFTILESLISWKSGLCVTWFHYLIPGTHLAPSYF